LAASCIVRKVTRLAGALALLLTLADAGSGVARAQGKLEATYTATLSGLAIGSGSWTIDVENDQFTATASGTTSGLLRIFASGQGDSVVHGTVSGGQPISSTFASTVVADQRTDKVRVWFSGGNVKEYIADPPTMPSPDRVPFTDAHRKGVVDPMTAWLVHAPHSCRRFVNASSRSSTAACAMICIWPSSGWTRSKPTRAIKARSWSARFIFRRLPGTFRIAPSSNI
jgi:hypothetical protein